ncbi:mitochondrial carrier [Metschnikowia bicuspidata var. bicuspidata NRRL YB-4993]|uniref:Mitochondrial carrier n=1 Tax=Metschnikowia bicuspidata var. bicuspidata NRRL YB-4993 TaxID=869754 RepID=A0A1A0H5M0_9ASCO|nr:mitochondrial carrier [Metschnikowia bicuspidata var. bicuspidata NRRL YB-4993]OBA19245.1 mitochondrial carrier [Metschnikowia bicuspidata var. bicuspidata NRRL YB-4993]
MPGDSKLRPYYDHDTFNAGYLVIYKPGVGLIDTTTQKEITSSFTYGSTGTRPNLLLGNLGIGGYGGARTSIGLRPDRVVPSSDINYINDLELSEYLDLNNLLELLRNLVWSFFKNYCRVLLSQPLDIVRLTLQVGYFKFSQDLETQSSPQGGKGPRNAPSENKYDSVIDDSLYDDEEIDFFPPSLPQQNNDVALKNRRRRPTSERCRHEKNPYKIHPISQHTVDILSAIAAKDGPFALFRGVNALFIHYTLSHTIEAWITGFLSPFLNIPDPFFLDLTHSTEPARSLWLSVLACVLTGIILMPLDLIKVRFMITSFDTVIAVSTDNAEDSDSQGEAGEECTSSSPEPSALDTEEKTKLINLRSVRDSLRHYPAHLLMRPPLPITILTVLYQISTIVFRKSAPYFLFVRYNIDSYLSPNLFTLANLVLLITEFFIKLPVENLLRKEQVKFLLRPKTRQEDEYRVVTIDDPEKNLIVDFNGWDLKHPHLDKDEKVGVWGRVKSLGLFKGWRVGVLNVIGFWGYNIVKSTSVMAEERL